MLRKRLTGSYPDFSNRGSAWTRCVSRGLQARKDGPGAAPEFAQIATKDA